MSSVAPDTAFQNALGAICRFENKSGEYVARAGVQCTLKEPRDRSPELTDAQKYLVVLSKIYTGDDTCAAAYKKKDGTVLIANNTGVKKHFDAVGKVMVKLTKSGADTSVIKEELCQLLKDKDNYIDMEASTRGAPEVHPLLRRDVDFIVDNFSVLAPEGYKKKGPTFVANGGPGHIHAEMRLLGNVVTELTKAEDKSGFIATPKLMCSPCDETVTVANEIYGIQIDTVGTHGKTYAGWRHLPGTPDDIMARVEGTFVEMHRGVRAGTIRQIKGMHSDEPALLSDRGTGDLLAVSARSGVERKRAEVTSKLTDDAVFPALGNPPVHRSITDVVRQSAKVVDAPERVNAGVSPGVGAVPVGRGGHSGGRGDSASRGGAKVSGVGRGGK